MDTQSIRTAYLDFFEARDHTVVPSASLIPVDPTLLLTVAGMVPFKPYLLGEEAPPYKRAVTVQKCVRTADIDIVGTTARHLTFFQMMGNFSFGDYFKEKAIPWAYEFVTDALGLDPDRLWFTVHLTDDEAADIWIDGVGIPPDRLQRRDKDNFWQMGVAGPCGPSSEIFYDRGSEWGPDGGPVVDEERFMEIWNLVFMQHVQDEPFHVIGDLPAKNIDTGAGLERLAMVLQDVSSAFHTDELRAIIAAGEAATGARFGDAAGSDVSLRILGDHGRSVTFLIGDGVIPSNEGRGYVLRRLLRRAVRHAFLLGAEGLVVPRLVATTIDTMGEAYPELRSKRDLILETAEREEVRFRRTLESGHSLLDTELGDLDEGAEIPGGVAFKLHDTYGFPIDLTEEIARERGYTVDRSEFETQMARQRERARAARGKDGDGAAIQDYRSLLSGVDTTEFVGYDLEQAPGSVLAVVVDGEQVAQAGEGADVELFLDRTPFYAESGGQMGDSGSISTETGTVRVEDTQFALPGIHGHRGTVTQGTIRAGQEARSELDQVRRERLRKNHTGTHLLHWALRSAVGDHVNQAGSLVAPDRLRFDFSHFSALDDEEIRHVERSTNERIVENAAVTTVVTSKDEAEAMGALAFFGDKYGERVRVVRAGDYSTEFCGGTHVPSTGQVGPLVLVTEGSIGSNLRRVEAYTGVRAWEFISDVRRRLDDVAATLRAPAGDVVSATAALVQRSREQEERIEAFEEQLRSQAAGDLLDRAEEHGGHPLLVVQQDGLAPDETRGLAFQLRDRLGGGIGVVGSVFEGKATLVAFVAPGLAAAGVSAGEILAPAAKVVGGGGGRDPELAQAGGPHGDRLPDALETARETARTALLGL